MASGSTVNMWWRTRTSIVRCGPRRPEPCSSSTACAAPTTSWWWKCPSASVAGLPMSWRSAASRTIGRPAGRSVDRAQRVVPEVLAVDLVLRHAALRGELRRDDGEQAGLLGQSKPDRGTRRREQARELRADPLPGEVRHEGGVVGDRGARRGLDVEVERRSEPDRPYHPERILPEPGAGIADRAEDTALDVADAVERVDDRGFDRQVAVAASGASLGQPAPRAPTRWRSR